MSFKKVISATNPLRPGKLHIGDGEEGQRFGQATHFRNIRVWANAGRMIIGSEIFRSSLVFAVVNVATRDNVSTSTYKYLHGTSRNQ